MGCDSRETKLRGVADSLDIADYLISCTLTKTADDVVSDDACIAVASPNTADSCYTCWAL